MPQNPLQQYFRQPKIFIGLPSHGIYNKPGAIQGDADHMPVYGMTGMDEILMKTPDALLTGESTITTIQSCCPAIKDATDLSVLDIDLVLAAIRIATYGNSLTVLHVCPNCSEENEYNVDLNRLIDFYSNCKYENRLALKDLTVTFKPLNYKQSTDFSLKNFKLQQQLNQLPSIESEEERQHLMAGLYKQLSELQVEVFLENIEAVEAGTTVVEERDFIAEWLKNSDKEVSDAIKAHIQQNNSAWTSPKHPVKCSECGHETEISVDLDQSNFFVSA